ncbi:hypothetical protein PoB_005883600, partial [Plakobranchus ocellatus]
DCLTRRRKNYWSELFNILGDSLVLDPSGAKFNRKSRRLHRFALLDRELIFFKRVRTGWERCLCS